MKKILLILLAFVYLGLSQGPTVYLHYCMGELVQMGLEHPGESAACDFCGMSKTTTDKEACCQEDAKSVKIDNVQKIASSSYEFAQTPVLLPKSLLDKFLYTTVESGHQLTYSDRETPPLQDVPVFIRNCTYRI
jgi:hypothetical protein